MTARKRPGPKPKSDSARSVVVVLRLTPEEHARMTEAAKREGLSLGPWMRRAGLLATAKAAS